MTVSPVAAGVGLGTHELVWVEGVDAVTFLDSQLTQDVAAMAPGTLRRSLLLEPRGKLRSMLWVLRDAERVGLVVAAPGADGLIADLARFRLRVKADLRRDSRPVHTVWGGESAAAGWSDDGTRLEATTPRYRLVASRAVPDLPLLDAATVSAHRIASGEPLFGVEVDEGTIPQETGLVAESVSFTKGCYLGQELVARIDSRGHVNRMLRRLDGEGPPPAPGAAVSRGEQAVGILGSVAPIGGRWIGLALLRREAVPGDRVTVRGEGGEAVATVADAQDPPPPPSQSPNALAR
jgi:folate-binding protein YgfZ